MLWVDGFDVKLLNIGSEILILLKLYELLIFELFVDGLRVVFLDSLIFGISFNRLW